MSGYSIGGRVFNYYKKNPSQFPYTFVSPITSLQNQVNTIKGELSTKINTINKDNLEINNKIDQAGNQIQNAQDTNIIPTYSVPKISSYDSSNKPNYGYTNIRIGWYDNSYNKNLGLGNVCVGNLANGGFYSKNSGNYNVSLGNVTLTKNVSGEYNVAVGHNSQFSCSSGSANTTIGYGALYDNVSGSYNVAIGSAAGNNNLGSYNTFLGRRAGRTGNSVTYNYTTCIGTDSVATGDNQVVLGKSSQNVYGGTYNTISDARDKTEIRDTVLGIEFIEKLRPVDYKYKFRNDTDELIGRRYHHGLIAQEVKTVMDNMDIDFGGYQDHNINGGSDQLTLGYSELIGPMIKSIQQLNEKIRILEEKLSKYEN
jgi:hypothetical protein